MKYWPQFAHLLHIPPAQLGELTTVEFEQGVRWIEDYIKQVNRQRGSARG